MAMLVRWRHATVASCKRAMSYMVDQISSGEPAELEVWAWGRNQIGQVGNGKESIEKLPVPIFPLKLACFTGMAPVQGRMPVDIEEAAKAEEIRLDVLERVGVKQAMASSSATIEHSSSSEMVLKPKPRLGNVGISCGLFHSILMADQKVWVWGKGGGGRLGLDNEFSQDSPYLNPNLKHAQMVAAGGLHTVALTDDGNVYTWGYGAFGALGHRSYEREVVPRVLDGPWEEKVVHVSAGGSHTAAVTDSGELYTWGRDEGEGRLGHGESVKMDDGALWCPWRVRAMEEPVAAVSCGGFFTMALTKTGKLWAWGGNKNGELGDGTLISDWEPKLVPGLEDVNLIQVACGGFHTAALTEDGKVVTWGFGKDGQLGHGNLDSFKEPTIVEAMADKSCRYVACGPVWTAAITDDGELYTWGKSRDYQLGLPGLKDEQPDPTMVQFPEDQQPIRVLGVSCGANHGVCIVSRKM